MESALKMESAVLKTENEMETEETNNSDGGGSRKRPLDTANDDHEAKRSNITEDELMNLKVMIPTQTAGALIGKNGETIAMIQKETNCRIKMSKNNDFFPCTNERLALISGPANCILKVVEYVIDKTKEKYDQNLKSDQFDHKQTERWKEIKMIIPSSSAGMIIGKAGEYIKSIKDQTGAFVQISAKEAVDHRLLERVVTVVGNSPKELLDGAQMIVAKLLLDPNQSSQVYTNVSYHQVINDLNLHHHHARSNSPSSSCGGGGYGGPPPVPPFQQQPQPPPYHHRSSYSPSPANYHHYQSPPPPANGSGGGLGCSSSSWSAAFNSAVGGGGGASSSSANNSALSNLGNIQVLQFLEGLRSTLRNNGYNETSIAEIMQAMQVLAKYNVLGLGLGFGLAAVSKVTSGGGSQQQGGNSLSDSPFMSSGSMTGLNSAAFLGKDLNSPSSFGAVGSGRQCNVGFAGFDSPMMEVNDNFSSRRSSDRQQPPFGYGGASDFMSRDQQPLYVSRSSGSRYDDSGPPPPLRDYASSVVKEYNYEPNKLELAIPEAIVGAVLGKQGRNLLEIQHFSGAKVEVSKRGQYVSGTQDRLITIAGSPDSIRVARMRIEKSINDEQSKRESRRY